MVHYSPLCTFMTNPNLEDANIANVKRHMLFGWSQLRSLYIFQIGFRIIPTTSYNYCVYLVGAVHWATDQPTGSPDARPVPGGKQRTAGAKLCAFSITCGHLRICFADHHWSRDPTIGYDPIFCSERRWETPTMVSGGHVWPWAWHCLQCLEWIMPG